MNKWKCDRCKCEFENYYAIQLGYYKLCPNCFRIKQKEWKERYKKVLKKVGE